METSSSINALSFASGINIRFSLPLGLTVTSQAGDNFDYCPPPYAVFLYFALSYCVNQVIVSRPCFSFITIQHTHVTGSGLLQKASYHFSFTYRRMSACRVATFPNLTSALLGGGLFAPLFSRQLPNGWTDRHQTFSDLLVHQFSGARERFLSWGGGQGHRH